MKTNSANVFASQVCAHLRVLRGQAVILDSDLAWFLGIEPAEVIVAVENHPAHFPEDFVFALTRAELDELQHQSPCLTGGGLPPEQQRFAFTTHGAGMLLTVFMDERFALAAIPVLRAFANVWNEAEALSVKSRVNRKS